MLTAIKKDTEKKKEAFNDLENPYNTEWECPVCEQETLYVKESHNGRAAHFRHKKEAAHPSISESKEHDLAKRRVKNLLEKDNNFKHIELEKPLGDQIADIYIKTKDLNDIAVEIQISPQGPKKFKERTLKYTKKFIRTLWILWPPTFLKDKEGYYKIKKATEWVKNRWFGRCYFIDHEQILNKTRKNQKKIGAYQNDLIQAVRPERITKNYEPYTYKTRAKLAGEKGFHSNRLYNYSICLRETQGYLLIARFKDKKWWN